jgi:hypothetical protein
MELLLVERYAPLPQSPPASLRRWTPSEIAAHRRTLEDAVDGLPDEVRSPADD